MNFHLKSGQRIKKAHPILFHFFFRKQTSRQGVRNCLLVHPDADQDQFRHLHSVLFIQDPALSMLKEGPDCESKTATSLRVEIHKNPLARMTSIGHSLIQFINRSGWKGRWLLKTNDAIPYSSVSGTCSSFNSLIHPAPWLADSKSNNLVFSTSANSSSACMVCTIFAAGLRVFRTAFSSSAFCSGTKSVLFKISTLANSIWSISRSAISRSSSSVAASFRSSKVSPEAKSCQNLLPSTTVTNVSNLQIAYKSMPMVASAYVKVWATGTGSLIPEDSMTMYSMSPSFTSFSTSMIRSSRSVQQIQPFCISTNFSSVRENPPCFTNEASIFTSLISFTIT